ncbi:MAG: PEP-CTERM sorting domain-containing protein [Phenylobacterium sp.]|uniref:PEP-CTERM sorting domain-containing protein n=1 Tax=Phenylobacterium sp. TaxID=1871053 RepID=UPI001A525694|nr:PEP-CTERM sorting domain-containing protein [Phenylobacterium sp.]MBL8770039.1 PEP-CTERM sorting domain-containing protein [Phenylobacterium sp.]
MRAPRLRRAATTALAAALVFGSPAMAGEVLVVHGVWQAQGDHAAASASTDFWLPAGDYIVTWSSPQPFGEESHWAYDFQLRQHYETYAGEVLFDFVGGDTVDPIYLPVGARSWSTRLSPYDRVTYDPMGVYSEQWREAATIFAVAGVEAVGRPFTLRVTTIPEPSTWALIIAGLLLAGGRLRRRSMTTAS